MARAAKTRLSRLELGVMDALWKIARGSVREIHEALPERKRPAYTTVQTIVGRLEEKSAVRRVKKISNALIFEPVISREEAHQRLVKDFLQLIGGVRPLVAQLLQCGELSLKDVRDLEKVIEEFKPKHPG